MKKSTACGNSNSCVYVGYIPGRGPDLIVVAGQPLPKAEAVLMFTPEEWETFVAGVKAGEFDLETLRRGEGVTPPDVFMPCPDTGCDHRQWVSPEDSDASFSDLWSHVVSRHTLGDRKETETLMARVTTLEDEDGNPIKENRA